MLSFASNLDQEMIETKRPDPSEAVEQKLAEKDVDRFRRALGPFVVATEMTRMAMVFTNASEPANPIIFANDSFLALTGFHCSEVVGQSFSFLMSRLADPGAISQIETEFHSEATETIEIECRCRDGHTVVLAIRINPVHDTDGMVVQHCISFVNMSAHIERVRQERDALHALYQHTPDFIATTQGPDHRFSFANDAFQRLADGRGRLGHIVAHAMPELAAQGFVDVLTRVYETGTPFTGRSMAVDLQRARSSGSETRFIDFICQAIRSPEGEITGIFCEGHDVTDQKLAAEKVQLLQAEVIHLARASAMGTIAATLAHELSQPLTVISNHAELLCQLFDGEAGGDVILGKDLHAIMDSATRAREIIRRLKGMTKRSKPERAFFDLGDLVGETLELLSVGVCGATFLDNKSSSGIILEADRVQIQQVIVNLTKNGCEAASSRGRGRVAVSTSIRDGRAVVSVQDNGHGVLPIAQASLFEWSDSTKPDGMGIGLSICKTIIDAHDGEIWLEKNDGQGSCFRFSLPLDP